MKLRDVLKTALIKKGKNAKARIAIDAGVSISTLTDVEKNGHVPKPATSYAIALACDCSEQEALSISQAPQEVDGREAG